MFVFNAMPQNPNDKAGEAVRAIHYLVEDLGTLLLITISILEFGALRKQLLQIDTTFWLKMS